LLLLNAMAAAANATLHARLPTPPEDVVACVTAQCDQLEDVLGCHRGNLQYGIMLWG
jgi:hypothetical protein